MYISIDKKQILIIKFSYIYNIFIYLYYINYIYIILFNYIMLI